MDDLNNGKDKKLNSIRIWSISNKNIINKKLLNDLASSIISLLPVDNIVLSESKGLFESGL